MKRERLSDGELRQRLEGAGLTGTSQRLAIARWLLCEPVHPTAGEVFEHVQAVLPVVSRATVYNTLKALVKAGLVREVRAAAQGPVRYDGNTRSHHHLLDVETGTLVDIPLEEVEIANLEALKKRYRVRDITITLQGETPDATAPARPSARRPDR